MHWVGSVKAPGAYVGNDILRELGVGVSWGTRSFRIGRSGAGTWWISVGIPGTGFRFSRALRWSRRQPASIPPHVPEFPQALEQTPPEIVHAAPQPSHNEAIVEEMRTSRPPSAKG
jgi:hypothetical protein